LINAVVAYLDGQFRMDILLAVIAGGFWLKVLNLLKLTKTFGPLIKIIFSMVKDISTLLILWSI
jgi:hypothetical protein